MKTGKARAPRGAKKRAVVSLVGRKAAEAMTQDELFAFWSARTMRVPPPLRTSFGNFTTVNSVERITLTTNTNANRYLWIPWTPSPLAAFSFTGGAGDALTQYLYNTLATASPLAVRPLRSSWSIECTTQLVNVTGSYRVYSYDNAILTALTGGLTASSIVGFTTGGDADYAPLINSAPDTEEIASAASTDEREFVSVPASYPAYNAYYDFIPFSNITDASSLQSVDATSLITGNLVQPTPYPYLVAPPIRGGQNGSAGLGGLPPMRGFLVEFPAVPSTQTYRITFHRQDGARYPVNSLGATFATNPPKMDAAGEDRFLGLSKMISLAPSTSRLVTAVSAVTSVASALNTVLGNPGLGAALGLVGGAMRAIGPRNARAA